MKGRTGILHRGLGMLLALSMASFPVSAEEILKAGDTGERVLTIEQRLSELGYFTGIPDECFDAATEQALLSFQRQNDLLATGMADAVTVELLLSDRAVSMEEVTRIEADYECFDAAMPLMGAADGAMSARSAGNATPEYFDTREYTTFQENGFHSTATAPLSTFAADVDTASWTQVRQMVLAGEHVPADSVRIEEMLNYFSYSYARPEEGSPFGVTMELGDCPWNEQTKLLLIGLQAEEIAKADEAARNLVFLIDVSGSMNDDDKLPLAKRAFMLLLDELKPTDTVSIVTYASADEVVLEGVPASEKTRILEAIDRLEAGGSTNGADGIRTAYEIAEAHSVENGVNRILLATDGDLNVGVTSEGDLARLVSEKREGGVELTVLGFGGWNYKDNRMEALADYGNGNYWYIDTIHEARRALVTEGGGTFHTVAKDVKLQLDFNPATVKGYRLIGYEDRLLDAEDFADDSVDGGEIGSGHRVTALYELVPADSDFEFGATGSRYAQTSTEGSGDLLTLGIRWKAPDGDVSELKEYTLSSEAMAVPTENLRFAAAVAEMGMLLRGSEWAGTSSWDGVLELLRGCDGVTGDVCKEELVYIAGLLQREAV